MTCTSSTQTAALVNAKPGPFFAECDSVRRGSGGRGSRGGGRRPASASDSQLAVLTGVAVQMEGLGPDAPAVPVLLGEPSRGDFRFVSFVEESTPFYCCAMHSSTWSHHVYLTNLPFLFVTTAAGRGGNAGRAGPRPPKSSPRPDAAPTPRPSSGGHESGGAAAASPQQHSRGDAATSPRPARARGRGGL